MLHVTENYDDIPQNLKEFQSHSWFEGDNVSFVNLSEGQIELENFTCYEGWRYQILVNNCSEEAEVEIRIGSGGNSDDIYSRGCMEDGYAATSITMGAMVIFAMVFNCTCCCCLFCKCCLPCARFCA
eukprot:TRINITY_DN4057_c0_g2_i1.p2 TRINITY_DN4057_c0_g2~~TRINITY_DN4057_c0_g2_i1.p2  ORF type:complete len:127 (-),score=15.63 TRINITY_DN4057_c0_g2_i1:5-385(-)